MINKYKKIGLQATQFLSVMSWFFVLLIFIKIFMLHGRIKFYASASGQMLGEEVCSVKNRYLIQQTPRILNLHIVEEQQMAGWLATVTLYFPKQYDKLFLMSYSNACMQASANQIRSGN